MLITLAALLAPGRSAVASESSAAVRAQALVRRVVQHDAARGAIPGVLVIRDGRTLASRNASRGFTPASLMKLATTTTALLRFGPDERLVTRIVTSIPPDEHGVVSGSIALIGAGDPTLATASYARRYLVRKRGFTDEQTIFSEPTATVERLAARVVAAGVTRIEGDLIADETLFDRSRVQRGWRSSYTFGDPDVGLLSALPIDEGFADLRRARISPSPALRAAVLFRRALRARGIVVAGGARLGAAPADAVEVARFLSPPMRELVAYINRWSENYPAEILLKLLGARFGGAGSTVAGGRVVRAALEDAGIDAYGLRMYDGSGLSVLDRMTPRIVAAIIGFALRDQTPAGAALRASFPVARRPGTLLLRKGLTSVRGNLRGKTGHIREVRGMAGWVTASNGRTLIYVALFNRARSPLGLTPALDLLGTGLLRVA